MGAQGARVRAKGQSDLVDIAQVFQRSGTRSVSWAAGKGPAPQGTENIASPEQYAGKKIGVWDFGNEYEVTAAGLKVGLVQNEDYTKVIQPFDMTLLLNRQIDVAEAMICNEYAQILEAKIRRPAPLPAERRQRDQLQRRRHSDAAGRDLCPRSSWRRRATRISRQSSCAPRSGAGCSAGTTRTSASSTRWTPVRRSAPAKWMMNEILLPLIWPSPSGVGQMPVDTWNQTVNVAIEAKIIPSAPDAAAYRTDLAEAARQGITGDVNGNSYVKGTVQVTEGGK